MNYKIISLLLLLTVLLASCSANTSIGDALNGGDNSDINQDGSKEDASNGENSPSSGSNSQIDTDSAFSDRDKDPSYDDSSSVSIKNNRRHYVR